MVGEEAVGLLCRGPSDVTVCTGTPDDRAQHTSTAHLQHNPRIRTSRHAIPGLLCTYLFLSPLTDGAGRAVSASLVSNITLSPSLS